MTRDIVLLCTKYFVLCDSILINTHSGGAGVDLVPVVIGRWINIVRPWRFVTHSTCHCWLFQGQFPHLDSAPPSLVHRCRTEREREAVRVGLGTIQIKVLEDKSGSPREMGVLCAKLTD